MTATSKNNLTSTLQENRSILIKERDNLAKTMTDFAVQKNIDTLERALTISVKNNKDNIKTQN